MFDRIVDILSKVFVLCVVSGWLLVLSKLGYVAGLKITNIIFK